MSVSVGDLCQQHDMTIEQLAEQSGLAVERATAIALGRWTPSPQERSQVAAVFGIAIEEISWGHKTPIQHLYGQGPA